MTQGTTPILQAVERRLDELVQLAEDCAQSTQAARSRTQDAQFRNLQNLAAATDSVLALENFIQYQMGRGFLDEGVGKQILKDFDELNLRAEEISRELQLADEGQRRQVKMELIRLYLGFLARRVIAERKLKG